jgi:hypothetical protein
MLNIGAIAFMAVAGLFLVALPRRLAAIPLLLTAAYTTRLPVIALGPANLSVLRILVVIGLIRMVVRGEQIAHGLNTVDRLLLVWAAVMIGLSPFHTNDGWTFRIGMVLGDLGVYFLCRAFVQDAEDVRRVFGALCIALVPLGVLLLLERFTAHNFFGIIGGISEINMRAGRVRAYGPFAHPILAGTVGATCVPMAICVWKRHRLAAVCGLLCGAAIVFASTSTGPIMMTLSACGALFMWNVRHQMRLLRWAGVAAIIGLDVVMNDPVYFVMARIDITGSSTGWHRAQLIRSAVDHLGEWWAIGADYTRHWMPTGIHANEYHTDITNHFLQMGVLGGLPLLLVFVLIVVAAFRALGRAMEEGAARSPEEQFVVWTVGAMLFAHVVNFWSISLFDQSSAFFSMALATVGALSLPATAAAAARLTAAIPARVPQLSVVAGRARSAAPVRQLGSSRLLDDPQRPPVIELVPYRERKV